MLTIPQWSTLLTIDVALPHLESSVALELKPFHGQVIGHVWKRISKNCRAALEAWYASI